jgi:transcriptional regulator with XRE-family HTH domain
VETPARRAPGVRGHAAREGERRVVAQRIIHRMQKEGWSGSELARRAGIKKDVVSTAINGKSYPSLVTLSALAKVFRCSVADLSPLHDGMPNVPADADPSGAPVSYRALPDHPGYVYLTVNKVVRTEIALQVLALVEAQNAPADH